MELLEQPGGLVRYAEAIDWTSQSPTGVLLIGITNEAIAARARRGLRHLLGQMYGVVGPGMIMAQHVFQGLQRHMYVRDDEEADSEKLAVSWSARRDAILAGDRSDPNLEYQAAPENRVFVVYVSINRSLDQFPDIYGWAEHWTWIANDPNLPGAPIDWETRYTRKLWSKGG